VKKLSKKQWILIIALILLLFPKFEQYTSEYEVWQFGNLHYTMRMNKRCWKIGKNHYDCTAVPVDEIWDTGPIPPGGNFSKYTYRYESMFFGIEFNHDFGEEWKWMKENQLIVSLGPLIKHDFPFWLSVTDKDIDLSLGYYWILPESQLDTLWLSHTWGE
jgi:hypothetical protein